MTQTNNLFVDANVLLEILFQRPKYDFCKIIFAKFETFFIPPTAIHVVFYFASKYRLDLDDVEKFISEFQILTFTEQEYSLALDIYKKDDMEDALQVACCLNHGIANFFTLDQKLQNKYKN